VGVVGESSGASATRQVVGVSTQSSLPRIIFEQGGYAYTAEPAGGAEATASAEAGTGSSGELIQTISDQNAVNAAVLVVVAFYARAGAKTAASLWALSFTGACLMDAYLIWSLV
jgi:hypothetical protein